MKQIKQLLPKEITQKKNKKSGKESRRKAVEAFLERHNKISKEFQHFGLYLAEKLNDKKHRSLYIKLAKDTPRPLLEQALQFAIDFPEPNDPNLGRLFMWKLKKIKDDRDKEKEAKSSKISGAIQS